jgi:hypothetical protein
MNRNLFPNTFFLLFIIITINICLADKKELKYGAFEVSHKLTLPGAPEAIYDAITGDISGWWDHSFTKSPKKFYIEPKPGGGFWEIFNETGEGVKHAEVIVAERGKMLRFVGPLGLSGNAIHLVTTYELEARLNDSTMLKLTVRASGQMEESWPDTIERVWHHFLVEQFKPYVESGKHLKK